MTKNRKKTSKNGKRVEQDNSGGATMLDYMSYYTTTDGKFNYNATAIAIHTMRVQYYHPNWTLKEIMLFETLLTRSKRFSHKEFFYQQDRLEKETRIKEHSLRKCTNKLKRLGLITVRRGKAKEDRKNYYTINFEEIENNLEKIYDFSGLDEGYRKLNKEILKGFFDHFQNGRYYSYDDLPEDIIITDPNAKERHRKRVEKHGAEAPKKYGIT